MDVKKEDFVKFRIVNTTFYALPPRFFKEEEIIEEVVEEVIVELTEEELATIAKESKIAKLKADLKELEV